MSITVKYTNNLGGELTSPQALKANEYNKEIYENGQLKMIESYQNQQQWGGEYYVGSSENLQNVIDKYLPVGNSWIFYYNKQSNLAGDILWEYKLYTDGNYTEKGKKVFDVQDRILAQLNIDAVTYDVNSQVKYYYGDPLVFEPSERFSSESIAFYYNEYGIEVCTDFFPYFDYNYDLDDFLAIDNIMEIFPWEEHTYYHSFDPILPPNPIV